MSNIVVRTVESKKDLNAFIRLPFKIHKNHSNWLPPLIADEEKVFDAAKNHSFVHCETILLLAERDKKIVASAQKAGMEIFDSHLIMEDNAKMRAMYERFDAKVYKTYRIFQKAFQ